MGEYFSINSALLAAKCPRSEWTPEQNLWACVLLQAIKSAINDSEKDIKWLHSDNEDVRSFNWILLVLGLEHAKETIISIAEKKHTGYKRITSAFGATYRHLSSYRANRNRKIKVKSYDILYFK